MVQIIALEYLEPDYRHTRECIEATGIPAIYVSRDGVGNMARAFNSVILKNAHVDYRYLWFITNITFEPDLPHKLAQAMEDTGFAAIHPAMRSSDHAHQWPNGSNSVEEVPFIEWTAPLARADVFAENLLDEMLPYYYFDLDWCYRIKQHGYKAGVHHGAAINHTYLRNNRKPHPVSRIRKQLRNYWTPISQRHMVAKYGEGWKEVMKWEG